MFFMENGRENVHVTAQLFPADQCSKSLVAGVFHTNTPNYNVIVKTNVKKNRKNLRCIDCMLQTIFNYMNDNSAPFTCTEKRLFHQYFGFRILA